MYIFDNIDIKCATTKFNLNFIKDTQWQQKI